MEFDGIEWDDGNWPKCGKHGLTKAEIERFLREGTTTIHRDTKHGHSEDRYLAIGSKVSGHAGMFVGFTTRRAGTLTMSGRLQRAICMQRRLHAMTAAKTDKGKPIPHFESDEDMEHFVDTADLSEYDLSSFVPVKLVFRDRVAHIDIELPSTQMSAVEAAANKQGVSSDQFIREAIDNALKKAS